MLNKEWLKKNKFRIIFFIFIFVLINYISNYFRSFNGDLALKFTYLSSSPSVLLSAFPLSINTTDLIFSFVGVGISILLVLNNQNNNKTFRKGIEHGSAEWGKPNKDLKGMYNEKNDRKNILFTENTKMALNNSDMKDFDYHRNKNTLIIGGSGSGKTRFFVKPNIMQMNSDYVVTDPKGDILKELGVLLKAKGNYEIKVLNLIEFDKSMRYNPLAYVNNEQDILKVVETIIKNTSAKDAKEDFWVTTEKLLYQALIGAILEFFKPHQQHLGTLSDLVSLFEVKEDDEDYVSEVDNMFIDIEEYNPNSFALKQYQAFKLSAGETAKSILISCATRLAPLNIPAVRELLSADELKLDEVGNKFLKNKKGEIMKDKEGNIRYQPTALFIIVPDTDTTFNFIASIMYTQMFNLLVTIADTKYNGELPRHLRFLLDEFANIGEIPDFQTLIATIRSRNISATPILQTKSQLESIYKKNSETIIGNCDTLVFLGGKETSTLKMISEQLGKQTIDDYNTSRTRSQSDSYGQNYSKLGRELMTPDELGKMDRTKAIVMITGLPAFKDNKYDIMEHPNFKYHGKPPLTDQETGKIIKEGKNWFPTDEYIDIYRENFNYKLNQNKKDSEEEEENISEVKTNSTSKTNSNLEEVPNNRTIDNTENVFYKSEEELEAEQNIEDPDEEEKNRKKKELDEMFMNENVNITVNNNNSKEISLLKENNRIKTYKKPETAI